MGIKVKYTILIADPTKSFYRHVQDAVLNSLYMRIMPILAIQDWIKNDYHLFTITIIFV